MGPGVLADCTKVPFVATSPPAQPGARNCHDCRGHLPVVPWLLARSQSSGESLPACNAINRGHGSRWLALLPADAVKIEMASGVLNPQGRSVPQSHSTFLSGRRSFHRTGAGANRVESGAVPECNARENSRAAPLRRWTPQIPPLAARPPTMGAGWPKFHHSPTAAPHHPPTHHRFTAPVINRAGSPRSPQSGPISRPFPHLPRPRPDLNSRFPSIIMPGQAPRWNDTD